MQETDNNLFDFNEVEMASRRGAPWRLLNPWGTGEAKVGVKGEKTRVIARNVLESFGQPDKTYSPVCAKGNPEE